MNDANDANDAARARDAWSEIVARLDALGVGVLSSHSHAEETLSNHRPPTDAARAEARARVPASYRAFVEQFAYPLVSLPKGVCRFALLPEGAMAQISAAIGGVAFFAGWDFSNVDGWCFATGEEGAADRSAPPRVWLVTGGTPRTPVGSFGAWMEERAREVAAALDRLGEVDLAPFRVTRGEVPYIPSDIDSFD